MAIEGELKTGDLITWTQPTDWVLRVLDVTGGYCDFEVVDRKGVGSIALVGRKEEHPLSGVSKYAFRVDAVSQITSEPNDYAAYFDLPALPTRDFHVGDVVRHDMCSIGVVKQVFLDMVHVVRVATRGEFEIGKTADWSMCNLKILRQEKAATITSAATIVISGPPVQADRPTVIKPVGLQHDFSNPYILAWIAHDRCCVACGVAQGIVASMAVKTCKPVMGWREREEAMMAGKLSGKGKPAKLSEVLPYRAADPLGAIVGDGRLMGLAIRRLP